MTKGFALLAAALVLALSLCGCGNTENSSQLNSSTQTEQTDASTTPETSATEQTKPESAAQTDATTPLSVGETTPIPDVRSQIVQTAQALVGIDFATGGASPETGFDNSGLIYYVLRENGYINCPRATAEQKQMGTVIGIDELQPGDLVFFIDKSTQDVDDIGFGGIYIGDGKLIYSPYPGEKVKYADLSNTYWRDSFDRAVKVF